MSDRIGPQLGNYRLVRLLGQGGFAEVYLAEHILLGTTAALKVLRAQVTKDDVAQFQQEARLLASLKHSHIVHVFDFGVEGQTPYLVMEYALNGTLRTRHARGTSLSLSTVVEYVKQIAEALQYAHDRKIVHRDVKPENILIGDNNEILLSDFGIALIAQSSRNQSTQEVIGTVAYMSPEHIQGKPRPASDQYSLGIVVYEWLSGGCPFQGSFTELCTQHMFASPPSLREKVTTISPEAENVIFTALSKDPKQRFGSIQAFATALERAYYGTLPNECSYPPSVSSPPSTLLPPSDVIVPTPNPVEEVASFPHRTVELSVSITTPSDPSVSTSAIQVSPAPPNLPIPAQTNDKPTASRRAAVIGLASLVVIAAFGGGRFIISSQQSPQGQTAPQAGETVVSQGQLFFTYRGHSNFASSYTAVNAVAWSPDGKRIASGSSDDTVQVWNASDGSGAFIYRGHSSFVLAVGWSPDGHRIASGAIDGSQTLQVWNASDGSYVFGNSRGYSNEVNAVAWSPDGTRIAFSQNDTVQLWNASDGSNVFTYTGHPGEVTPVAWSPDGKRIASGYGRIVGQENTVQVWNASDGSDVFTYRGHSDVVTALAWSPDGTRIASGSYDKTVQVWNASDGSDVFTYRGHSDIVNAVAWSPDGKHIASGSGSIVGQENTVQVWNASNGSGAFTYRGHSDVVNAVAWSPDGKYIASGSRDSTVQVWQAE